MLYIACCAKHFEISLTTKCNEAVAILLIKFRVNSKLQNIYCRQYKKFSQER